MRIDAHQHFWKYDPSKHSWINDEMSVIRKDFLPNDLSPILRSHNLDGTVAVQADETMEETELLLSLSEQFDFIKAVVGWMDLRSPAAFETIAEFQSNKKLVGFRCIMQGQPDEQYLKNDTFIKNVSMLSDVNYTYDLLVFHDQLSSLIKMTERLPDNKMILDHIGKPTIKGKSISTWKENIFELAKHPGIYCKLSGMITEADYQQWKYDEIVPYMDVVAEAFGIDRLCYGSDWPVCLVAGNYKNMFEVVDQWAKQLNVADQEKLFGLNTCRFYNI